MKGIGERLLALRLPFPARQASPKVASGPGADPAVSLPGDGLVGLVDAISDHLDEKKARQDAKVAELTVALQMMEAALADALQRQTELQSALGAAREAVRALEAAEARAEREIVNAKAARNEASLRVDSLAATVGRFQEEQKASQQSKRDAIVNPPRQALLVEAQRNYLTWAETQVANARLKVADLKRIERQDTSASAGPAQLLSRLLGAGFGRRSRASKPASVADPLRSCLFDGEYYRSQFIAGFPKHIDPLQHYLDVGWKRNIDPHALFCVKFYLARNPDVAAAGLEPLGHYLTTGSDEGRDPHPLFSARTYRNRLGSRLDSSISLLENFLRGGLDGVDPHPLFDNRWYAERAGLGLVDAASALLHYLTIGWTKGLDLSPLFDRTHYLRQLAQADGVGMEPYCHYVLYGAQAGLTPHPLFDTKTYLAVRTDVDPARTDPLLHYLEVGEEEDASPNVLFDPKFYRSNNEAVGRSRHGALWHYVTRGAAADAQPHPLFDAEYVAKQRKAPLPEGQTPLGTFLHEALPKFESPTPLFDVAHYISKTGAQPGFHPLVHFLTTYAATREQTVTTVKTTSPRVLAERPITILSGHQPPIQGAKTVLAVAHLVGQYLFGSERSYLDLLEGFAAIGVNVVAVLPANIDAYTEAVRHLTCEVIIFKYGWWRSNSISEEAVEIFEDIILGKAIDAVHANTIMLREPLLAAANCGVAGVLHVRELIHHDDALAKLIDAAPKDIVQQTLKRAQWIIGNSRTTAAAFNKPGRTFVVRNTIDMDALDLQNRVDPAEIRFGIISSNIPKKGINDVVSLARACEFALPNARFLIIGPDTPLTNRLRDQQSKGLAPQNLSLAGYAESPRAAMEQINVVLSFSNFAESFGRTVLEAMAARRPVIAYNWGAVPELVEHGVTGELVPYGKPLAAMAIVQKLCDEPELILRMGEAGRRAAVGGYSKKHYASSLAEAYRAIIGLDASELRAPTPAAEPREFARGRNDAPARILEPVSPVINALEPPPPNAPLGASAARVLRARAYPAAPEAGSKLRIAYFCWHFPVPSETFVLSELRHLVAEGYDVLVFCRQIPHKEFKPDFPIVWRQVTSPQELTQALIGTGRTVAHGHFVYPTVTDFLWPACEAASIPFTFIAHAQDIFRYSNDEKNRIAEITRSPLCLRLFVLSTFHREYVIDRGVPPEKIVINPNAVDTGLLASGAIPNRADRAFRAVCAVHRFSEKKGLELLIRAGKELAQDGISIDLYGYGELEDRYRQVIAELDLTNVRLCGRVHDREELCSVFRRYDLFACPSVRTSDGDMDGIPTAVAEAMAAGLPVLTTAISGIPDLVTDRLTGLVCEATAASIAETVRRYYAMPAGHVEAMIEAARRRVVARHDINRLCRVLLRVWECKAIDILIVSWKHFEEHREVLDRLYRYTTLPFHVIVCANSDQEEVVELLEGYHRDKDNFTLIHNGYNSFVGPGTNRAMDEGWSDIAIYVCGKEGFALRPGWEIPFVHTMAENPEVGLAGTLCHSPTYLTGKQYPTGVRQFHRFRNQDFAAENPDRAFNHIQGGLFAIRRAMYEGIGGFSEAVPHEYTDVEYSYYAESRGWKLAEVEGLLALFNKSRPTLAARIDETVGSAHPLLLADLETFEAISRGQRLNCNVCSWNGDAFVAVGTDMICPACRSGMADRSLFRWLAPSFYLYRRLPAIAIGLVGKMEGFWAQQFQGPRLNHLAFLEKLRSSGKLPNRAAALEVGVVRGLPQDGQEQNLELTELARILKPGAKLVIQSESAGAAVRPYKLPAQFSQLAVSAGFEIEEPALYFSHSMQLDWAPLFVLTRMT